MPHDPKARRDASAVPLVLFGEHGRTVEGYRPADEDLVEAVPASANGVARHVAGPHLRLAQHRQINNKTGLVGISVSRSKKTGRHYLYVQLGSTHRAFCIETLGRTEAWRRAVALRREHLRKIDQANAVIERARKLNLQPNESQ